MDVLAGTSLAKNLGELPIKRRRRGVPVPLPVHDRPQSREQPAPVPPISRGESKSGLPQAPYSEIEPAIAPNLLTDGRRKREPLATHPIGERRSDGDEKDLHRRRPREGDGGGRDKYLRPSALSLSPFYFWVSIFFVCVFA